MKLRELVRTSGFEVYLRQADPSSYLNVLKDIKMKEIFNIIIDIQPENMVNLLNVVSIGRIDVLERGCEHPASAIRYPGASTLQ